MAVEFRVARRREAKLVRNPARRETSLKALWMSLKRVLRDVRACRICEAELPLGPRPVVQLASTARLLIVGQAPGSKVHRSGIPWNDASGDRLRDWLGLDRSTFFDEGKVAILPMGFCYPGVGKSGGDNPPRAECAPHWHKRLLKHLPRPGTDGSGGQYAHRYYLDAGRNDSMTEAVKTFSQRRPEFFPLPHPRACLQLGDSQISR